MTQTKSDTKLPAFSVHMVERSFLRIVCWDENRTNLLLMKKICQNWIEIGIFFEKNKNFTTQKIFVINKSMEIPKIILKNKINPLN